MLSSPIYIDILNLNKVNIHTMPSCKQTKHACMRDEYLSYVSAITKIFP